MALNFVKDQSNGFTIILEDSSGTPVTGETSGSVNVYASKNGGSSFSPSYSTFNEVDATNMPGLYFVEFGSSTFDTYGEVSFVFSGTNFASYRSRGVVTDDIDGTLASIDSTVSTNQSKLGDIQGSSFDPNTDNLVEIRDNSGADLTPVTTALGEIKGSNFSQSDDSLSQIGPKVEDIQGKTTRILGLSDENLRIENYTYDSNHNVTSADVTIYPSKTDLENKTNSVASYKMSATYNSDNELIDYSIKRTS